MAAPSEDLVYAKSSPEVALGVAGTILSFLADNNVQLGDGVAGLTIALLSSTRPDIMSEGAVSDFIYDLSVWIAKWQAPVRGLKVEIQSVEDIPTIPEVPGGLSNAN